MTRIHPTTTTNDSPRSNIHSNIGITAQQILKLPAFSHMLCFCQFFHCHQIITASKVTNRQIKKCRAKKSVHLSI